MDARFERSRLRLREAVLVLAAREPIQGVSVAAVAREARLTRDTFYRHASSPLELLADTLAAELADLQAVLPPATRIRDGERVLLEHVRQRSAVYRGAMAPSLAAPVRTRLEEQLRAALNDWARRHPQFVPDTVRSDDAALRMAVAYAASGTVGAIEEWLREGTDDVDRGAEVILAASPEWWLR